MIKWDGLNASPGMRPITLDGLHGIFGQGRASSEHLENVISQTEIPKNYYVWLMRTSWLGKPQPKNTTS